MNILKKITNKDNNVIILISICFSIFFCYLARLPKHGDFWGMISLEKYLQIYTDLPVNPVELSGDNLHEQHFLCGFGNDTGNNG